ncbi:MAG: hypothetical protein FWG85_00940 [Bacteroidetes bacterium]|nr:hypothetical protein [Bacteroidota bacterium]
METLELEKSTSKINPQLIISSDYIDLSQYETIPALDEAIKDIEEGRVSEPMTMEEFREYLKRIRWEVENEV